MQGTEFEINRDAVRNYFLVATISSCFGILVFCSPISFPFFIAVGMVDDGPFALVSLFFCALFANVLLLSAVSVFLFWLCQQQANNLRYRLDETTVRADGGVFFLFRKSIPLERITDVALVQGPLLRFFDIWTMRIQTAGSPQCEATLYGVRNPEEIRELILSRRQRIYGEKAGDA